MVHTLQLPDGTQLDYQLKRRARKTVGLKIGSSGLVVVHAPQRLKQNLLEKMLLQRADWIRNKIQQIAANQPAPIAWQDGTELYLLGEPITLRLQQTARRQRVIFADSVLRLELHAPHDRVMIASKVIQWYKTAALPDFAKRLEWFAARLGVKCPRLHLSSARQRWGSCSSKREIRINWRLLQAPPHIIDYVICHELAHLKEMNHSARFWAVVASLYPDYRQAEKELRARAPQLHLIQKLS